MSMKASCHLIFSENFTGRHCPVSEVSNAAKMIEFPLIFSVIILCEIGLISEIYAHSIPPENFRKPEVFFTFSGGIECP